MKINEDTSIGNTGYSLRNLLPYILYDNSTGNKGDIELNDTLANYSIIDIQFKNTDQQSYWTSRYYNPNGKKICMFYDNITSSTRYIFEKQYNCDGKYIKKYYCHQYNASSNAYGSYDSFNIVKVIGFK